MRSPVICCLAILLAACSAAPEQSGPATTASDASHPATAHVGFPQGAYIWQQIWTPAHRGVLANSHDLLDELRVLAAQQTAADGWSVANVDMDALQIDARKVRPVIRLDGRLPALDANAIVARSERLVADWRAAGVNVDGIEIDFDGTSSRLGEYTRLLDSLRTKLPKDAVLSITLSPDWIGAIGLPALLERADEAVLQLHATNDPARERFDPSQASHWIDQFSAMTKKTFRIALPSYGSSADVAAIDAGEAAGERRELGADPVAMATLLRDLEHRHPAHLQGVLWFRLPLPGDRRAWPLATLGAVINAQPLHSNLVADVHAADGGAFDLAVGNRGTLESTLPAQVDVSIAACAGAAAEPMPGYRIESGQDRLHFVRESNAMLPAGQTRAIGRVHCAQLTSKDLHVRP